MQDCDYLVNGPVVWAEHDADVDIDMENNGPAIIKEFVEFAWCKTNLTHPFVHVFVPDLASFLLAINIAYEFENMGLSGHPFSLVTLLKAHVEPYFHWCSQIHHDEVELTTVPALEEGQNEE